MLWLDAVERRYVEEVGTSNIFFVIDDELITPPLEGLHPARRDPRPRCRGRDWGWRVSEQRLAIDEVIVASESGALQESFGTGTAR